MNTFRIIRTRLGVIYRRLKYFGRSRYCPICSVFSSRFLPYGLERRPDAMCPHCRSLERHRLAWLLLEPEILEMRHGRSMSMLHFAPERCLARHFRAMIGPGYLTADLQPGVADVEADITALTFSPDSFDLIYCSHVLEHVTDDRAAIRNLVRVLRPAGLAFIAVPVIAKVTLEDPLVIAPEDRLKLYGQSDHLRAYGPDFKQRLEECGFRVNVISAFKIAGPDSVKRMALPTVDDDCVFICSKS